MFEVGVARRFSASHRLRGDFGPASQLHVHDYRVELVVTGERLGEDGTLCDIGLLRTAVDRCVSGLDGRILDELPQFVDRNSTAENVAAWLAAGLAPSLTAFGLTSLAVTVFESPDAWARCARPLPHS